MIAHQISRKGSSSYRRLADYILTDSGMARLAKYITIEGAGTGLDTRVLYSTASNCVTDEPALASLEIEAVQKMNTRAKGEKTYHLVVSFREDERSLSADELRAIEIEICGALGLAEHQRISAVHADTNNLHMHLAINKIHPRSLTIIEPYRAWNKLSDICLVLEEKYRLKADNHIDHVVRKTGQNPQSKSQVYRGVEPLQEWIRKTVAPNLAVTDGWRAVHSVTAEAGLSLRRRGNGLVFLADSGEAVKASSVSRDLSLSKLQARFGPFQPAPARDKATATAGYTAVPAAESRLDRQRLWRDYQQNLQQGRAARKRANQTLRTKEKLRLSGISAEFVLRRKSFSQRAKRGQRAAGYSKLRLQQVLAEAPIRQEFDLQRAEIERKFPIPSWPTWLQDRAGQGSAAALATLQAEFPGDREDPSTTETTPLFRSEAVVPPILPVDTSYECSVGRYGTVDIRTKNIHLRDTYSGICVMGNQSTEAITAALRLAASKYGPHLRVSGNAAFCARAATIAAQLDLRLALPEKQRPTPITPRPTPRTTAPKKVTATSQDHTASKPDPRKPATVDEPPNLPSSPPAANALQEYLDKRNQWVGKTKDTLPHRALRKEDHNLVLLYTGRRRLSDGSVIALLTSPATREVLVYPLTDASFSDLRKGDLRIGASVSLNQTGKLRGVVHEDPGRGKGRPEQEK